MSGQNLEALMNRTTPMVITVAETIKNDSWIIEALFNVCRVVDATLTVSTVWILCCLVVFGLKTKKWNRKTETGKFYIACFVTVAISMPRFIVDQTRFFIPDFPGALDHCELIMDIAVTTCGAALFATYLFLWMRQRAIYANPLMEALNGQCYKWLSWSMFAFLIGSSTAIWGGFVIPLSYGPTRYGCIEIEPEHPAGWDTIKHYTLGGIMVLYQLMLLLSFIFPMIQTRQRKKSGLIQKNKESDILTSLIRRSVLCASFAVSSDIATVLLSTQVIPRRYPSVIRDTVYDVSLFVNICCVVSTLNKNRNIMTVFCSRNGTAKTRRQNSV